MALPEKFIERVKRDMGVEQGEALCRSLLDKMPTSIRLNPRKPYAQLEGSNVPWNKYGRYLDVRPSFTLDIGFNAGTYYVQEAGSQFVGHILENMDIEGARLLDMCAAPGGKSTLYSTLVGESGLVVANEIVRNRAAILADNVRKWGVGNVVVTNNEPRHLATFENWFDIVAVDAPCSGEGMFRKDSFAVEQWSVSNVMQCAKRQRDILSQIWSSLRPGGLLVYSTCTFNREENEDCVEWVANELGATPLPLEIDPAWGITGSLTNAELPVYRFIPGFTAGEGFFLAVLRKDGESDVMQPRVPRVQKLAAKTVSSVKGWLQNPSDFDFVQQGEQIVALPKQHSAAMLALQQKLRVLHLGIVVALVKNNKILPHHSLSMSVELDRTAFPTVDVTREQALSYLHRETLSLPSAPVGFLLLQYEGTPLGFVKNIGNRANNLYPAEWRIRKDPMEL